MAPKASAASAAAVRARMKERGLDYTERYGNWNAGDKCGIENEAGEFVIQGFHLHAVIGDVVCVVGGPVWGQSQVKEFRVFDVARLSTKILKRGKKPTTEEEEPDGME